MILLRLATTTLLLTGSLLAQQREDQSRNRTIGEVELPLPMTSPRAIQPGTMNPLTPKEKLDRAIRNTIGFRAIGNRFITTWWDHATRDPEEWGGNMDGYGKRFAARMGSLAVRQSVQLGVEVAMGIEPRYDRCACTGFKSRTAHAWRRVILSRKDNGSEILAYNTFAGAYIPPLITDQWYPASKNTWSHKWQSGTAFLALRGGTNMIREFWPGISRKFRLERFKAD